MSGDHSDPTKWRAQSDTVEGSPPYLRAFPFPQRAKLQCGSPRVPGAAPARLLDADLALGELGEKGP